jgi:hypothetical protein
MFGMSRAFLIIFVNAIKYLDIGPKCWSRIKKCRAVNNRKSTGLRKS